MTTAIDSVELTRVGPDTVMGQLMREYWIPALMSSELARGGVAWREADRISRQLGAGRGDGSSLPPSLRFAVSRPQRGGWDPLHLSRLEIRRFGKVPRYAECAATSGLQTQGQGQSVPSGRARRHGVGIHGFGRQSAATAGVRDFADGYRSTMSTPCTVCCGGSAAYRP
jgi:hypothetical protein